MYIVCHRESSEYLPDTPRSQPVGADKSTDSTQVRLVQNLYTKSQSNTGFCICNFVVVFVCFPDCIFLGVYIFYWHNNVQITSTELVEKKQSPDMYQRPEENHPFNYSHPPYQHWESNTALSDGKPVLYQPSRQPFACISTSVPTCFKLRLRVCCCCHKNGTVVEFILQTEICKTWQVQPLITKDNLTKARTSMKEHQG